MKKKKKTTRVGVRGVGCAGGADGDSIGLLCLQVAYMFFHALGFSHGRRPPSPIAIPLPLPGPGTGPRITYTTTKENCIDFAG